MKHLKIPNGFHINAGLKNTKAQAGTRAQIFLYGVIGWEINVQMFLEEIEKLPADTKEIDFYLHSPGGYVDEGLVLLTNLARLRNKYYTRMYIDGIAASMASAIALEADETHASSTSQMMLHNAWLWLDIWGGFNSKEIDDLIEDLKQTKDILSSDDEVMAEFYAKKTGMSVEEIKSTFLDGKDHFLTPKQMLEFGLIDSIIDTELPKPEFAEEEEEEVWLSSSKEKYRTAASAIKTPYKGINEKKLGMFAFGSNAEYNKGNQQTNFDTMKNKLAQMLGLDPNSSDEVVTNAVNALKNDVEKLNKKTADQQKLIDEYKTSDTQKDATIAQMKSEVTKTKAQKIVSDVKKAAETKGMAVNKNIDESLTDLAVNHLNALEEGDEEAAKNFREHMELKAKANLVPIGSDPSYSNKEDRAEDSASLTKEKLEKTRAEAKARAEAAKNRKPAY